MNCENNEHIWFFKEISENKIHIDDFNWGVINVIYPKGLDPNDLEIEFKANTFSVIETCSNCKEERIIVYQAEKIITKSDDDWDEYSWLHKPKLLI
jgi:hypothetical protein